MPRIVEVIDVDVPVRFAYDAWTRFTEFPRFLRHVRTIDQLDDTHLHWTVGVGGATREFDAEVTQQRPDDRVAWRSTSGTVHNAGVVTFHRVSNSSCRVTVQIDWEADGFLENLGAALGVDDRVVETDLDRFKAYIENRYDAGDDVAGWRGTVSFND